MTNEELIGEAFKWAKNALPPEPWADTHIVLRLAHALELATNPVTFGTEYGVRHFDSEGEAQDVWLAEDEHEARYEATEWGGIIMTRAVGPWGQSNE
jgi:hypothetical protein